MSVEGSKRRTRANGRGAGLAGGLAALAGVGLLASAVDAQPINVRAWYADGQVFVVWQNTVPPASPTDTVEVFASSAAQVSTANMSRVGRMFFPEYTGARLQELMPGARLLVPGPGGGTYRLAADEGVFAYTPRAAGNLFFAVVDTGSSAVMATNSAPAAFAFDPVNDPVVPHAQFRGPTPNGQQYVAYVVWADGRDDFDNQRPDVPVMADADKNGVPHVFAITEPLGGVPAGPLSTLFALHGGGGEYELFLPGVAARANMQLNLNDGIVVTPDDSYFADFGGSLGRTNTSWFGYSPVSNPFDGGTAAAPPDDAVVVNFTSRRVRWIIDWLQGANSPYTIDPSRVAMVGHSGGGRGTSIITRTWPELFSSVICYTPASDLTLDQSAGGQEQFQRGDYDQNLATNLTRDGATLHVTDVFDVTKRISAARDWAYTRFYFGKRDDQGPAAWSASQRAVVDALNDSELGVVISWDEREHGVEKWDNETNDATDGYAGPWPDVGQWVSPQRSRRAAGQYLVDTYRAGESYPGFFNADADPTLAGRQPDPGPGDPNLGDPWGTWEGYLEFDRATLTDEPARWAATVWLTGLAATAIDNAPVAAIAGDVAPRRVQSFLPTPGRLIGWTATDIATGVVLQSGTSVTGAESEVVARGVSVPRDPARVRLELRVCRSDMNSDGVLNIFDILEFFGAFGAGSPRAERTGDGTLNIFDIFRFFEEFGSGC